MTNFSLFANFYSYRINSGSFQDGVLKIKMLFTQFDVNLTPEMIDDLSRLFEFVQNFSISLDLKQYRPQRRPVTIDHTQINERDLDENVKRKRKLVVRDWFFFVVWYVRLRKILNNFYSD